MSKLTLTLKLQAFRSNFELAMIVSICVIMADMAWLAHDIFHYGLSIWYCVVGTGLFGGLIGSIFILFRHNSLLVRKFRASVKKEKLLILKHKRKHLH